MTWEFKVGQKVVCVNAEVIPNTCLIVGVLRAGDTYTIRTVGMDMFAESLGGPVRELLGVRLYGIKRISLPNHSYLDQAFSAARFRPLVTDTQSWLKEILETPPPAPMKIPIMHPDFTTEYVEIGDGWGMR